MERFARAGSHERPARPSPGLPGHTSNSRRQMAVKLKVTQPTTELTHNEAPQDGASSRGHHSHSGSITSQRARPPWQGPPKPPNRDMYDTDVESLDTTTIPHGSVVQVLDSQRTNPDEEEHKEMASQSQVEGANQGSQPYEFDQEEQQILIEGNMCEASFNEQFDYVFGDYPPERYGSPYPTTTSGRPDASSQDFRGVGEQASDEMGLRSSSPSPQRRPHIDQQPIHVHSTQHVQHFALPTGAQQTSNPGKLFGQAASIRESKRSIRDSTSTAQQTRRRDHVEPLQNQLPKYPPSTSVPATTGNVNQNLHLQDPILNSQQHIHTKPGIRVNQAARTLLPPEEHRLPVMPSVPQQNTQSGQPLHDPFSRDVEQDQTEEEESTDHGHDLPVEDYDASTLVAMPYGDLVNEDFDHNPRANRQVLSEDMQQKSLPDRLEHVHKRLATEDQSKFFTSMSTAEWEDAGDWFLDQFSSIVRRTKEARQKKRKLAHDLEQEIHKRHDRVTRKRQKVDTALSSMKSKGQQLIPQSPRVSKSKSPAPKSRGPAST